MKWKKSENVVSKVLKGLKLHTLYTWYISQDLFNIWGGMGFLVVTNYRKTGSLWEQVIIIGNLKNTNVSGLCQDAFCVELFPA